MSWMPIDWARRTPPTGPEGISLAVRMASGALRTAFIALLLILTVRISLPQSEAIRTAYDTPGDLLRMALGLAVCVWIAIQFFAAPKDAQGYRTWLYLGLVAVPFAAICVIAMW
jgi:hypothetical protein